MQTADVAYMIFLIHITFMLFIRPAHAAYIISIASKKFLDYRIYIYISSPLKEDVADEYVTFHITKNKSSEV